jgi:hypothetical protein
MLSPSARFASETRFSTPTRGKKDRSEGPHSPGMTLGELGEMSDEIAQIQAETRDWVARINETKAELNVLMLKTDSYSRNTAISYRDSLTPKSERAATYTRSPFGKRLQISDYSLSITPKAKRFKRPAVS